MMKLVALALALGGAAAHVHERAYYEAKFYDWMREYDVSFASGDEFTRRLTIFADTDDKIAAHNAGEHTWWMAHNAFSHLTWPEFSARMGLNGTRPARARGARVHEAPMNTSALALLSVDWTEKGAVTAVKDQGQCGSCWAFSTTGAIEGAYFLKNGVLPAGGAGLSEQDLVDCDPNDNGCNGGLMDNAFSYVISNGGLCTETDYPYVGKTGTCETTCTPDADSAIAAYVDVQSDSETALMSAVYQQPVSIAIEADQAAFQSYGGGVLTGGCGTNLDHGVLAVGYGTYTDGTKYWKVKNSWGASWGMDGYILLERGAAQTGGMCGLLMEPSYPTY